MGTIQDRDRKDADDTYRERAHEKIGAVGEQLAAVEPLDFGHEGMAEAGHEGHGMVSVREAVHRGRHIVVKTRYEITIDREPLGAHAGVDHAGNVHYHGLPNYAFSSMMDLVRKVVDASDVPLPDDELGRPGKEDDHGRHA